jgi:uncharacterized protein YndB with AHSA1/START domain
MNNKTFTFEQLIKARPSLVYHAFTNSTVLHEWMCDLATANPKPGGRLYMAWNSGFYMAGEYFTLEPDRQIIFSWYGRGEPTPSLVRVTLEEKENGTLVHLSHEQVGSGIEWENTVKEIQDGWKSSLENLASVLETGHDLRFTLRPMLGIYPGEYNAEIAQKLGVPMATGLRLDGVADGMGAQIAGLQTNDVLVRLGGHDLIDYADLTAALQNKRAGDTVEVVFYRGGEKMTVMMELSHRQLPDIPSSLHDLAAAVREQYAQMDAELDQFFAGVSEEEAAYKPALDEWSAKEVLAHLIHAEQFWRQHTTELVGSQESWTDDFAGNWQGAIDATLTAYPSLQELLAQLKLQCIETQALFAKLPEQILERKGTYWRLASEALQTPYHLRTHIQQMQAAIEAARRR